MEASTIFNYLGYDRSISPTDIWYIKYIYEDVHKTVRFNLEERKVYIKFSHNKSFGLSPGLINAINTQMKELGWLEGGYELNEN